MLYANYYLETVPVVATTCVRVTSSSGVTYRFPAIERPAPHNLADKSYVVVRVRDSKGKYWNLPLTDTQVRHALDRLEKNPYWQTVLPATWKDVLAAITPGWLLKLFRVQGT